MRPIDPLEVPGCNKFYALGHRLYGHEWDNHNVARVLYNTHNSAKNLSGVVVSGKVWGSLDKVQRGYTRRRSQDDQVYKDANAGAYCVSRNRYHINSISFEELAVPPLTATSLVAAHDRRWASPAPDEQSYIDLETCLLLRLLHLANAPTTHRTTTQSYLRLGARTTKHCIDFAFSVFGCACCATLCFLEAFCESVAIVSD